MELKYTRTGDYELPNLTLNDNKKDTSPFCFSLSFAIYYYI